MLVRAPRVRFAGVVHGDGVSGPRRDGRDVHPEQRFDEPRFKRGTPVAVAELTVRPGAPRVHATGAVHRRDVRRSRAHLNDVDPLQRRHRRRDRRAVRVGRVRVEP